MSLSDPQLESREFQGKERFNASYDAVATLGQTEITRKRTGRFRQAQLASDCILTTGMPPTESGSLKRAKPSGNTAARVQYLVCTRYSMCIYIDTSRDCPKRVPRSNLSGESGLLSLRSTAVRRPCCRARTVVGQWGVPGPHAPLLCLGRLKLQPDLPLDPAVVANQLEPFLSAQLQGNGFLAR